jgi:DedD protein
LASLAEDLNVDELRRRARRRLVGAIVLALAAAVIVPMLLESEPRPLGEDVAVKIPPVDDGKFVNRLNDPKGAAAPKTQPKTEPKAAPETTAPRSEAPAAPSSEAPKEAVALAPNASSAAPDATKSASAPATPPLTSAPAAAPAPAAGKSTASGDKSAPSAPEKATAAAPEKGTTAAAAKAESGFAVQLAAFSDDKGANALAGKLKRAGYTAYTEPLKTSKGTLWRVRVGPYPSREAATAARDKLKAEGQNGIVAAAH